MQIWSSILSHKYTLASNIQARKYSKEIFNQKEVELHVLALRLLSVRDHILKIPILLLHLYALVYTSWSFQLALKAYIETIYAFKVIYRIYIRFQSNCSI